MTGLIASIDAKQILSDYPLEQFAYRPGQQLKGMVIDKNDEGTTVQFEGKDKGILTTIDVIEAKGQMANFEVVENSAQQLSLKYLRPDANMRSFSDGSNEKMPAKVLKDYQQTIQQSLKKVDATTVTQVNMMVKEAQQSIETITNTMTDEDVRQMLKEGMNPEKVSLEIVAQVLKYNKPMLLKQDSHGLREAVEAQVQSLKVNYKNEAQLKSVVTALKEAQLPVTKKHVDKLVAGLNTVYEIKDVSSKEAMQILDNYSNDAVSVKEPTLEGLYKSVHTPFPSDNKLSIDPEALEVMVIKHLESQDIEVTTESVDVAKAMVQKGIAITDEKIEFALHPKAVMQEIDPSDVLARMALLLKDSENVTDVRLPELSFISEAIQGPDVSDLQDSFMTDIRKEVLMTTINLIGKITTFQTVKAVMTDRHKSLEQVVSSIEDKAVDVTSEHANQRTEEALTEEVIKFKKQLSVIQLKMTFDAAVRLEKQGIKIDTAPISQVVDSLEAQEANIRENQLSAYSGQNSVNDEKVAVYSDTMAHLEQSKVLDSSAALQLKQNERPITLRNLVTTSTRISQEALAQEVTSAMAKYGASMTEIRRDLGDRIEQTFKQIEPMLEEMDIPNTKANVQAVEILAKNSMVITEENILEIQIIQEKIDLLAEKMTPVIVVGMTQAGINPMDLTVDELLSMVAAYEEENQLTEASKISELILAMDESKALTNKERQSLMAIYRTMDTVTRSQGAATGFMVKNEMNLTINNLFEAAKYIRKTGQIAAAIQVDVNDNYGVLESVTNQASTLREQVQAGSAASTEVPSESSLTGVEHLRKELMDLRITAFIQSVSPEAYQTVRNDDRVDDLKELPLEEVTALMHTQLKSKEATSVNAEKYLAFIKENPDFLRTMVGNKIPLTFENFSKSIAMNQDSFLMMHEIESLLEKVESSELRGEMIDKMTKVAQEVLASKVPYSALDEAMEEVEQSIRDAALAEPASAYRSAASLKATVNHIQMIQVSEDYYQIPVFMGQEVTQLNMYILNQERTNQDSDESKVLMSFEAGSLGKVQALMTLEGNSASLQIQSTYPEDEKILKNYESAFTEVIGQSNYSLYQVGYKRFTEKEPIEIIQEAMSQRNNHDLPEGHMDWSV